MNVAGTQLSSGPGPFPDAVINDGISEAAHALMEILDGEISIAAPRMLQVNSTQASTHIMAGLPDAQQIVSQEYSAPFHCSAIMCLDPESSAFILRCMFGDALSADMLVQLGTDGLVELANVLFNALLAPMLDAMGGSDVICSLPDCSTLGIEEIVNAGSASDARNVNLVLLDVGLPERQFTIRIALMLAEPARLQ